MPSVRELLDIAAEYLTYKDTAEHYPDLINPDDADAKLNEIAKRFESSLNEHLANR